MGQEKNDGTVEKKTLGSTQEFRAVLKHIQVGLISAVM